MEKEYLKNQAKQHVNYLCNVVQERRVGGEGNRKATTYFKHVVEQQGWQVEETVKQPPILNMLWNNKVGKWRKLNWK